MDKYKDPLPKYATKLQKVAKMAKEQQKYKTSLFIFSFKFITQSLQYFTHVQGLRRMIISVPKSSQNDKKNIKTFLILILQSDLLFIIQIFDSASKNCNNIKFVAHLVFDSGRETNKELNFIARSLMASCFFTSKWVYRVLTNFSPNPAKLKFRIHRIKMDHGSK